MSGKSAEPFVCLRETLQEIPLLDVIGLLSKEYATLCFAGKHAFRKLENRDT